LKTREWFGNEGMRSALRDIGAAFIFPRNGRINGHRIQWKNEKGRKIERGRKVEHQFVCGNRSRGSHHYDVDGHPPAGLGSETLQVFAPLCPLTRAPPAWTRSRCARREPWRDNWADFAGHQSLRASLGELPWNAEGSEV